MSDEKKPTEDGKIRHRSPLANAVAAVGLAIAVVATIAVASYRMRYKPLAKPGQCLGSFYIVLQTSKGGKYYLGLYYKSADPSRGHVIFAGFRRDAKWMDEHYDAKDCPGPMFIEKDLEGDKPFGKGE